LVAPSKFVIGPTNTIMKNNGGEDLQVILIDFGQAVDTRHPEATLLLQRDLDRILTFFAHQGIDIPTLDEALSIIIG
jgi:serine/threonine-protein kinase RIO1